MKCNLMASQLRLSPTFLLWPLVLLLPDYQSHVTISVTNAWGLPTAPPNQFLMPPHFPGSPGLRKMSLYTYPSPFLRSSLSSILPLPAPCSSPFCHLDRRYFPSCSVPPPLFPTHSPQFLPCWSKGSPNAPCCVWHFGLW